MLGMGRELKLEANHENWGTRDLRSTLRIVQGKVLRIQHVDFI